jgi:hypothetical protein
LDDRRREHRWVPAGALLVVVGVLAILPLTIVAQGYLPVDDALRHVAKAVSGRPWAEILVLRPGFELDSHPGWHGLLGALHRGLGLTAGDLLVFSIAAMFLAFSLPCLLLRRPEAWLISLGLLGVADSLLFERLLLGRPFLLASAVVAVVGLRWDELAGPRRRASLALLVLAAALATWIHGSFYLLALPVAGLLAARAWRAALEVSGCMAAGAVLGAALTGHPIGYPLQVIRHAILAMGLEKPPLTLVTEFQAFDGRPSVVAGFLALLVWRNSMRVGQPPARDPLVTTSVICWALGFVAARFWVDWGAVALLALAGRTIEAALERREPRAARSRMLTATLAAGLLFLVGNADVRHRWTDNRGRALLSKQNPDHAPWLPDAGGVLYTVDMGVFYPLFYFNPNGQWRYMLGFEPALMPAADFATFRRIVESQGSVESYQPWIDRMRPADRLFVRNYATIPPQIPGLEWHAPVYSVWVGRLPRQP